MRRHKTSSWRTPAAAHDVAGFCRPTEFGGDCESGDDGAWNRLDRQACVAKCEACPRCAVLSYSRKNDDCSWYAWCDLADTRRPPSNAEDYVTLRVRPNFAPPAPERRVIAAERRPSVRLAIVTLAIGERSTCGLVHWCEHARLFASLLPRAWTVETVIVGSDRLPPEEACGGRARVLPISRELLAAYRTCRRERRNGETLRKLDNHLDMAMIKWQVFTMTEYDLVFFCDIDISLTTREWIGSFRAKPDSFVARWRALAHTMTTRPLCIEAACHANGSWAPALAIAGRDHSSPVNTGLFFARPSLPLYRDGLAVLRGCEFSAKLGWQRAGSPRSLIAGGLHPRRVDGSPLDGDSGNLSHTEAFRRDTWLFAGGEVDQGFFWYMAFIRHDAGAYLDPDAASSHRPMHWWGSGCSGKPWATSSREELRQLKQGAHRWDCIQYRYGYLTRTLLADPNASRCATALWLQRREIEELGLAKPGDWGTSVGVTLL